MKKILLLNRKYTDNLGDLAIGDSLRHLLCERDHEVYHLEYSTFGRPINTFSAKEAKPGRLRRIIRSLYKKLPGRLRWLLRSGFRLILQLRAVPRDIDLIIIGGGQLINSEPGNDQFAYAFDFWRRINQFYFKTKLAVFAVGAGDHFTPYARRAFRRGLAAADSIHVRDDRSKQILQELTDGLEVRTVPDVAFTYSDIIPVTERRTDADHKTALVGIYDYETYAATHYESISRNSYYRNSYYGKWRNEIERLEADHYTVKLFYTTGRDKIETETFSTALGSAYQIVDVESVYELIQILNRVDLVYSGRMHALILALVYRCDIEVFPTNNKLRTFAQMYKSINNDKELKMQIKNELNQL